MGEGTLEEVRDLACLEYSEIILCCFSFRDNSIGDIRNTIEDIIECIDSFFKGSSVLLDLFFEVCSLCFSLFCFLSLAFFHQGTNLFREFVAFCKGIVQFGLYKAAVLI